MSQGFRTRHGWTTHEAPAPIDKHDPRCTFQWCYCDPPRPVRPEPPPDRFIRENRPEPRAAIFGPYGRPAVPPPAPSWVWAIVMCIAAGLIGLLVYLEAFK